MINKNDKILVEISNKMRDNGFSDTDAFLIANLIKDGGWVKKGEVVADEIKK